MRRIAARDDPKASNNLGFLLLGCDILLRHFSGRKTRSKQLTA
jgi:hypothetical protein